MQERDLRGPDDVDDERLRQQGFDEPTGLKQRRVIPTIEDVEHGEKSRVVENRADRPAAFLNPSLATPERAVAQVKWWILGVA